MTVRRAGGIAASAAALALPGASAVGAVTFTTPPPVFVAPGGELAVDVRAGAPGELRLLEGRRDGTGRVVARVNAVAGRAVRLAYRPTGRRALTLRVESDAAMTRRFRVAVRPVTLAAVGDLSPGSAIATVRAHGSDWHWAYAGPWLAGHDVTVANLETAIGRGGPPWPGKAFHFLAPAGTVRSAARLGGVDVVSLANNHALDFGRRTFLRGIAEIRAAGVTPFGGGADLAGALRPAVIRAGGLRIAFVGLNDIPPYEFWAGSTTAGNAPATPEAVRRAVHDARRRADIVVAYFHWGIEYEYTPTARQRFLAGVAHEAGAGVVIGAHPHVPQPLSRVGRGVTAWSLGNFLFQPGRPPGTRAVALHLELDARGVVAARLRPLRIIDTRPVFADG